MSGSKEYFALVTVILLQLASLLSGQVNLDLNKVIKSKCSEDGWSLIDSETIANPAILIPAKLMKSSSFSCASFQINLIHSGSLDISVYIDSSSAYSGVVILVDDGVNGVLIEYEYRMSNEDFEQGWHTISLPIEKMLDAEVTLLGFSDGEDIVLIDSIKYNKKSSKLQEDWTKTYPETIIIDLVPNDDILRNPDNDINSIIQEKSNEKYFDLSEVSLKQKSGEIQLIEVDKFERTGHNEENYSENSIKEQSKRSVNAVDDENDEDEIEGNSNGENNNAVYNDGDDENGEDDSEGGTGNGEEGNGGNNSEDGTTGNGEGNGEDGNGNGEEGNGEDGSENGNGEDGNGDGENGENNSENGNGEDGNGNGEDGNVEDSSENGNGENGNGNDGNGDGDNGENGNGEGDGEDGNGNGEDGNGEDNGENGNGDDGNGDGDNGENGNGESDGEDGNGNGEDGNGEDTGDGNGEDGNGDGDNGENGNGEDGNGENGNGENESAETEEVSQPNSSIWNTWTILLVSIGSATALGLVLAAAYHLGKVRGRDIPPPIDLSDLEAPRIIPRVTSARPAYERFGGSDYGDSSPELFAR